MRDFIYIDDCIEGMLAIGEHVGDGSGINLSTGISTSFNQYAQMAWETVHGSRAGFEVKNTSQKPEGVFARYGNTRLQRQHGFEARRLEGTQDRKLTPRFRGSSSLSALFRIGTGNVQDREGLRA
jgi:nucleoside-diphosphate-sugar epimerase